MKPRNYRSSIPVGAKEVVKEYFNNGAKKSAYFFVVGEKVGFRAWDENGVLEHEYGIRNEVKHGREYCFHSDGQPYEVTPYRNGKLHGTGKQWAADGSVLITYTLTNGVGLDLWCSNDNDTLSEEHYWPKDNELGYDRDWNSDEKTIWSEYYFVNGKGYHGIKREWSQKGKLRRGFPQYYVNDKRVTKRQYLKACENDVTLLPYRAEEDQPQRNLPREYLAQRKRKRRSCKNH